ncbi:Gfo/Idh/MocA family protein [Flavobacterium sp. MK4S-17]|uniref:Gfo/Idh/MocA family protein n=1 Tax=Flavobacterium sp. MK4S-17 TaxID=2543737 RepID=UPI0013593E19|nr:Gfo/Idh/MocA family oxidoreductase [Flavobacterium sp. MK4S-17]
MTETGTEKEKKILSLGFIGVGWIGRNRMEVLINKANAKPVAIAEPYSTNAADALTAAAGATLVQTPQEVYNIDKLDGVVIATPSAIHAAQSIAALKSGKAVFCQKPLGRTASEVKEVIQASQEAGKLLSVDMSYRHTKAFQAVYDCINNGEIGKIYAVDLIFHNAYGPDKEWFYDIEQSGGGCVMDLGIHMADMALCCLGFPKINEVKSHLFSKGIKLQPQEKKVEDFAKVFMLTEDDTAISIECSWHVSAGQDAVIEAVFYGTEGGVAFKNCNGSFYDFKAEKYKGTYKENLVVPPDDWSGRAGLVWASQLLAGHGYNSISAAEYLQTAQLIDRIYGRQD